MTMQSAHRLAVSAEIRAERRYLSVPYRWRGPVRGLQDHLTASGRMSRWLNKSNQNRACYRQFPESRPPGLSSVARFKPMPAESSAPGVLVRRPGMTDDLP